MNLRVLFTFGLFVSRGLRVVCMVLIVIERGALYMMADLIVSRVMTKSIEITFRSTVTPFQK